jgi:hypothetical protein
MSRERYLPGTQEKYNSFPVMKDDVKTVVNERRGGVWKSEGFPMKGLESFRNPPDFEEAGFGRPLVPPTIYCVNYNDHERREKMTRRFQDLDLPYHFVEPVYKTDKRLDHPEINPHHKRTYSIMLQHLDSLQHFLDTTNESDNFCIVCEDDIMISNRIKQSISDIMIKFDELDLDILLLGYLWPNKIDPFSNGHFPLLLRSAEFLYTGYPDDLWGSQLYMVSRKHARWLLNQFPAEYIFRGFGDGKEPLPYNPDWIITKMGKRAIISPMLAVEEGSTKTEHDGQNDFHRQCFLANYVESEFI